LVERQFITILFANVNVSGFVKVGMTLLNIETLVTRNAIQEVSLNMQDFTYVRPSSGLKKDIVCFSKMLLSTYKSTVSKHRTTALSSKELPTTYNLRIALNKIRLKKF
jgi:hypothetical protein